MYGTYYISWLEGLKKCLIIFCLDVIWTFFFVKNYVAESLQKKNIGSKEKSLDTSTPASSFITTFYAWRSDKMSSSTTFLHNLPSRDFDQNQVFRILGKLLPQNLVGIRFLCPLRLWEAKKSLPPTYPGPEKAFAVVQVIKSLGPPAWNLRW
jgi:hypothetical protein